MSKLRALLWRTKFEAEMAEELRTHLEMQEQANRAAGMSADEARFAARRQFGHLDGIKETARDQRSWVWLEDFARDLRFGSRMLRKNPGFTTVAVLTLALGIGANTAIFSLVSAMLLRPLPFKEPERIVVVQKRNLNQGISQGSLSPFEFFAYQEQGRSFAQFASFMHTPINVPGQDAPEWVQGALVSSDFFPALGVAPRLGRALTPSDHTGVVISHGFWQRHFQGDPEVVGKSAQVVGLTVVGVMPPGFEFPVGVEAWGLANWKAEDRQVRRLQYLGVVARLKPGISVSQAEAELGAVSRRLEDQDPDAFGGWSGQLVPLQDWIVGNLRPALLLLLGAVGFVLLIACANVANLLLARGTGRQKEVAIRSALGASRTRVARQFLTESVMLSLCGAGLGLMLAWWGLRLAPTLYPPIAENLPRAEAVGLDGRVLGFTFLLAVATGIAFGLAPALAAGHTDLTTALRDGARGSAGARPYGLRRLLVAAETALALVLLIGAGLMLRSFGRVCEIHPGFDPRNVLTVAVELPLFGENWQVLDQKFKQQLGALPGVESVSAVTTLPLSRQENDPAFTIERAPQRTAGNKLSATVRLVSPGYFGTMRIPLRRGRDFTAQDKAHAPWIIVINDTLARRLFPQEDPVGQRLRIDNGKPFLAEVVGVVGDVKQFALELAPRPEVYLAHAQYGWNLWSYKMHLVMRTAANPQSLAGATRNAVRSADPNQAAMDIRTMDHVVSTSVSSRRFGAVLLGLFGAMAMLLAALGIYGVMACSVSQRRHELGIRMALGAGRHNVLKLVIGQGMTMALAGITVGLAAALVSTRVLSSFLYGVSPTDSLTFAGVTLLLAAAAFAACWLPARRATKVDPIIALRCE